MVATSWAAGSAPVRDRTLWIRDRFWETVLVAGAVVYLAAVSVLLVSDVRTARECRAGGGHQAEDPTTHQVRCVAGPDTAATTPLSPLR